jgi:hypothetical protein
MKQQREGVASIQQARVSTVRKASSPRVFHSVTTAIKTITTMISTPVVT